MLSSYAPITEETAGFSELVVGEACLIQKLLLPREPLRGPNFEITYLVRTFGEVGGDFLDYFCLSDGKLGIYICDVVGKGLPAAFYAALAAGTMRSIHKTGEEPAAVLELFNKRLLVRPVPSRYCASQYAVFDPVALEIRVANAGLPFLLHVSKNGCSVVGKGGIPSGLFDFARYDQDTLRLAPGDLVLFATDGLSEAANEDGEQFGMSRLIDLCAALDYSAPDLFLRSIFDTIERFTGGKPRDDMTAVVLKAGSPSASTTVPPIESSERSSHGKGPACLAPPEIGGQKKHRLLIIDDDQSMRGLLRVRLEDSYEIIDTPDSQEGLALALREKPDAILLDLMMSTYSGLEVCQTLSSLSFTQRIPIFIVSGQSAERYKDFCANLGAKGFFQKPVDFDKLRRTLAEAVEGRHSARREEAHVRLRATLKLCGLDSTGAPFQLTTVTQNVTASGFQCECQADVKVGVIVEIYLVANTEQFIGRAKIVHIDSPGAPSQACSFQFIEKPSHWVLP